MGVAALARMGSTQMKQFRPLALAAVTLLAFAAPAQAAKSDVSGEMTLHIEAEAAIPPDRAEMSITLTGVGATKDAALSDLRSKQAALASAVGGAAVKHGDPVKVADDDGDMVMVSRNGADDAAVAAACDVAAEAAAPARPTAKRKVKASSCEPGGAMFAYQAESQVTITDLAQIGKLQTAYSELGYSGYRFGYGAHYFTSDPAAAGKAAREQAIAKARHDADDYAASLGCHVVRIIRVSNASPPFGMSDLHQLVGYADTPAFNLTPSYFGSATYATVGIDFVIAPN